MTSKVWEKLEEINRLYNNGHQMEAKEKLDRLAHRGSLSIAERLRAAKIYFLLGEVERSLKLHGKESSQENFEELNIEEMALVMSHARVLHAIGAPYAGRRLWQRLEEIMQQKNFEPGTVELSYYNYRAVMDRIDGRFDDCLKISKIGMEKCRDNAVLEFYNVIVATDACRALGNYDECLYYLKMADEQKMKLSARAHGFTARAYSEYYFEMGDYENAENFAIKAQEHLNYWSGSIESCVSMRCHAEALLAMNRKEEALPILKKSLHHSLIGHHPFLLPLRVLYNLDQHYKSELTLEEKVALRCHHVFTIFSILCGKKHVPEKHGAIPHYYQKQVKENDYDCWLVHQEKIIPACYRDVVSLFSQGQIRYDFVSGLEMDMGKIHVIQETQLRAQSAFIGNGALGGNLWGIIDLVYREEPHSFNYGQERLKSIISSLKKDNIEIERHENNYYLRSSMPSMIYPMALPTVRRWCFMASQTGLDLEFSKQQVADYYHIDKSTAARWIAQGINEGYLIQNEKFYRFTKSALSL